MNFGAKVFFLFVFFVIPFHARATDLGVFQYAQAPHHTLGFGYRFSCADYDHKGMLQTRPINMIRSHLLMHALVKYQWKNYWFGTAYALTYLWHTSDISSRTHLGLSDLQSFISRVDGATASGVRISIPTGVYAAGLGTGAFALTPFIQHTYLDKITVIGDLIYHFKNPDTIRAGTSFGLYASYRWHVSPLVHVRYSLSDINPWSSYTDSPSLLVLIGTEVDTKITTTIQLYGRINIIVWGADTEQVFIATCGIKGDIF